MESAQNMKGNLGRTYEWDLGFKVNLLAVNIETARMEKEHGYDHPV